MSNPAGSFIWYELMTTDADSAARFYGSVVGWEIGGRSDDTGAKDYRMILRGDGAAAGGVLNLSPDMLERGARPGWLGYLYVKDVDAATRAIAADGGKVLMARMDLPVGQIAMVADPMGAPMYVMRPIPPPDKPDIASDVFDRVASQRVRWNELASPDVARAKTFYARHFDFEFKEVMSMGPMGDYCFITHGGIPRMGAVMQIPKDGMPGWLFYFGVDSVKTSKEAIESGGGKVLRGPHQVPGGEHMVVATDPQGAAFGIVGAL